MLVAGTDSHISTLKGCRSSYRNSHVIVNARQLLWTFKVTNRNDMMLVYSSVCFNVSINKDVYCYYYYYYYYYYY